jgi:hypothetical protein
MKPRIVATAALTVIVFASPALAEDVEFKGCYTTEGTIIDKAGDTLIGVNVARGVVDRVSGTWPVDKMLMDCRSVFTVSKAGLEFTNRCTFIDKDDHRALSVSTGTLQSFQWKWIAGTGKYEGIAGSGGGAIDSPYPGAASIGGACWRGKGSYSIKK